MIDIYKLTNAEIDSLPVSRDLDIEILVRVFKFPRKKILYDSWDTQKLYPCYIPSGKPRRTHEIDLQQVPFFSANVESALVASQEIGRMIWQENFGGNDLNGLTLSHTGSRSGYSAAFMSECDFPNDWHDKTGEMFAASQGDRPSIAIIRALVKALVFVSRQ